MTPSFSPSSTITETVLNSLSAVTSGQSTSVIIPVPTSVAAVFTANPDTYPNLVGSSLPVTMATTVTDPNTGNQMLDVSNISNNTIVVVPSFIEGSTIEIGSTQLTRGTGSQSNLLYINGDTLNGISLGSPITIGDQTYTLSGIGSPVVFTVLNKQPTLFDYLLMYSYFFIFIVVIIFLIMYVFSIDPKSILLNNNKILMISVYVIIFAIISMYILSNT